MRRARPRCVIRLPERLDRTDEARVPRYGVSLGAAGLRDARQHCRHIAVDDHIGGLVDVGRPQIHHNEPSSLAVDSHREPGDGLYLQGRFRDQHLATRVD